ARLPVDVGSTDLVLADLTAPLGVLVSGWVTDGSGGLLAGTLVEAFVGPCASGQPATGDAMSDAGGAFRLGVPAPPTTAYPSIRRKPGPGPSPTKAGPKAPPPPPR